MKKVVLMSLETTLLEWSPAKYQLLDELSSKGFETYLFLPGKLKNRKKYNSINYVINTEGMLNKDIRKKIIDIAPNAVIATIYIDTTVIYKLPYIMKNTSFYYYNLEICTPYLNKEVQKENFRHYIKYKFKYPLYKYKEMLYTRRVKAFSIQDRLRMRLSEKYHIKHSNVILIPNSYVFDETKIISEKQTGVVYTGGIKRDFFLKQMKNLGDVKRTPLTFSGRIDLWCKKEMKKIKNTNPDIELVEQILSIDDYTKYLQQFAVGLVWYSPLKEDQANYYIGLSSGKMFKHLSLGQPIIATKCPGITETVNKYKLGIVIDNISELDDAYEEIMRNYIYYRENVIRIYRNRFDFKKVITPFIECIDSTS